MTKPKKRPLDQSDHDINSKPKSQKLNPSGENPVNEGTVCVVNIIECSKSHDGDETIFCEGKCGWLHRQCTSLSDFYFKLFTNNNSPFLCVRILYAKVTK